MNNQTSNQDLAGCPLCTDMIRFHEEEGECDGCHHLQCVGCLTMFDLSKAADPINECDSLEKLRAAITMAWNKQRASNLKLIADNSQLLAALHSIAKDEDQARESVAKGFHNTTFAIDLAGRARTALDALSEKTSGVKDLI